MKSPIETAETLDLKDPLKDLKNSFDLPRDVIYLDGNSLGPALKSMKSAAIEVVQEQWGNGLITSWNKHNWIDLPVTVGEKIARLIGAAPGQVVCTDSVSVNMFKLLNCALDLNSKRAVVLSESTNFPTDIYIADGIKSLLGEDKIKLVLSQDTDITASLNEEVAVLMLTQVDFRSGRLHDIAKITAAAQKLGIIVIWDLAHSTGALPLELDAWNVDFAVGCGYKYLNGGPGAPAFIYAAKRHHKKMQQPLTGWMGHKAPFSFDQSYSASPDIRQFLCGTPPIISMHLLNTALDIFEGISMHQIREKATALSLLFERLITDTKILAGLKLVSPNEASQRGNQLAYRHSDAYAICQALIANNVIADFRSPDILRFGFSPLFLSFTDIAQAVQRLESLFETKSYLQSQYRRRQKVT